MNQFRLACEFENKVDDGHRVILTHLVETVIAKLLGILWVKSLVLPAIPCPSVVTNKHIVSSFGEYDRWRLFTLTDKIIRATHDAMHAKDDLSVWRNVLPIDIEDLEDITIFSGQI